MPFPLCASNVYNFKSFTKNDDPACYTNYKDPIRVIYSVLVFRIIIISSMLTSAPFHISGNCCNSKNAIIIHFNHYPYRLLAPSHVTQNILDNDLSFKINHVPIRNPTHEKTLSNIVIIMKVTFIDKNKI